MKKGNILILVSIVLAVLMALLTIYTLWIGLRLSCASFIVWLDVGNGRSQETIDESYLEALRIRKAVAEESAYASFISGLNIGLKFVIFFSELAATIGLIRFSKFLFDTKYEVELKQLLGYY